MFFSCVLRVYLLVYSVGVIVVHKTVEMAKCVQKDNYHLYIENRDIDISHGYFHSSDVLLAFFRCIWNAPVEVHLSDLIESIQHASASNSTQHINARAFPQRCKAFF